MTSMLADALRLQLLDTTPDAVVIADPEGRIQFWNEAAARMFGYSTAEAIGSSLDLIIPERQRPRHWEGYARVMATGVTKYGHDLLAVPGIHKDGSRMSLEFTVALLHDARGSVTGIGAVMRDVTARRAREREMQQRITELEAKISAD